MPEGSEINVLTERVQALGVLVDWWNNKLVWALLFATIATGFGLVTTFMSFKRAKQKEDALSELVEVQNRQLAIELGKKDMKIAEAKVEAGEASERASAANERAATNEKEAARLNKLAEDERFARVKLEKQLAPRVILDMDGFAQELSKFASGLKGRKVTVSSLINDAEGIVFSVEIINILNKAGIETDEAIGRVLTSGIVRRGVLITGPVPDSAFIKALANGIHERLVYEVSDVDGEWHPKYSKVEVLVGVKPISGLPKIVPADATPTK